MGQILSYRHGESSVKKVDPRLWDIVQNAVAASPYDAEIKSAAEHRTKNGSNHNPGWAVDVSLIDPTTGKKLSDYQTAETFAAYEQYAQLARVYQQQNYPDLDNVLRWGGYFNSPTGPKGYGAVDLMHLDINPNKKGAMLLGSWDTGAGKALLTAYPGAVSNGGLGGTNGVRLVSQYRQQLAGKGGLVPPASLTGEAPVPANLTRGIDVARMKYAADADQSPAPTPATMSPTLAASRRVDPGSLRTISGLATALGALDNEIGLAATPKLTRDLQVKGGAGAAAGSVDVPGDLVTLQRLISVAPNLKNSPAPPAPVKDAVPGIRKAIAEASRSSSNPVGDGATFAELKQLTASPGAIRTGQGIAGTVVLPHDVTPVIPVIEQPAAAKPKLAPPTQTTDPAMRNAISSSGVSAPGAGLNADQRNAMTSLSGTGMGNALPPMPTDRPARANALSSPSAITYIPPPKQTIKGSSTGQEYEVGRIYQSGGFLKRAEADGTFTNLGRVFSANTLAPAVKVNVGAALSPVRAPLTASQTVSGDNMAFQPKSVQTSSRWTTGY